MATKSNGIDWGAIGQSALQAGISGGIDSLFDIGESFVGNYFNKTSAKKAYLRQLQLMDAQYQYAQKYAENSPSWAVKGLREAGLNPILAAGGGFHASVAPSSPSSPASHSTSVGGSRSRYDPLLSANIGVAHAQREMYEKQGNAADLTSKASMLNAQTNARKSSFDNMLKEAEIALKTLEKERFESGGNADSPRIRDARRTLDSMFNSFRHGWDYIKDSSNSPSSFSNPFNSATSNTPRLSSQYSKDIEKFLDIMFGNPYTKKVGILPFRGIRRLIDKSRGKTPLFYTR